MLWVGCPWVAFPDTPRQEADCYADALARLGAPQASQEGDGRWRRRGRIGRCLFGEGSRYSASFLWLCCSCGLRLQRSLSPTPPKKRRGVIRSTRRRASYLGRTTISLSLMPAPRPGNV